MAATDTVHSSYLEGRPALKYAHERLAEMPVLGSASAPLIALALNALEALFDHRADMFCLVTSDSDFAYLCRKLRERGAAVCIVGGT